MNKMNEKTRRNIILQLLLLAALIGATFWWLLRDCDVETMLATLRGADPGLIGLGLVCMAVYLYLGASSASVLFRGMGRPMGPLRRYKYHLIEFFFSAITPSSSGGQPFEVLFMRADGYKVTESSVVLLVVAVLFKLAMLALFVPLFLLNFAFLQAQVSGVWFLFLLGLSLNILIIVVILLALYAQRSMRGLCAAILRLLARMRLVRRPETAQEKLDGWLASFHDCAGFMRTHPGPVVASFCIVFLQRVVYLLIPWCVYEAMGLSGVTIWQMMGLQLLLSVSVEMMPLPGAVGSARASRWSSTTPVRNDVTLHARAHALRFTTSSSARGFAVRATPCSGWWDLLLFLGAFTQRGPISTTLAKILPLVSAFAATPAGRRW